jgi:hypothetical protein
VKNFQALASKINERAYEIYVSKGSQDGSDLDDWLKAEKEILKESGTKTRARVSSARKSSTRKKKERVKVNSL